MNRPESTLTPVASPFTVLVDTREQRPWTFQGISTDCDLGERPLSVMIQPATLAAGDYAVLDGRLDGAIERKSIADLVGTVFHGRDRFEAELERLDLLTWAYVIVEGDWQAVWEHIHFCTEGRVKAFNRSIDAWVCRFPGVHWWLMPTRAIAEAKAYRLMERHWKDLE